jgi:hypothetical protein
VKAIDANLELLKIHLPYHESDHVLTLAYTRVRQWVGRRWTRGIR